MKAVLVEKVYVKSIFSINPFTKALFYLKDASWTLVEKTNVQICPQALRDFIRTCNRENIDAVQQDVSTNRIIKVYEDFQEKLRLGLSGKTARFWILIFYAIFAVKTNNKKLFHKCKREVGNLLFAYDGRNFFR